MKWNERKRKQFKEFNLICMNLRRTNKKIKNCTKCGTDMIISLLIASLFRQRNDHFSDKCSNRETERSTKTKEKNSTKMGHRNVFALYRLPESICSKDRCLRSCAVAMCRTVDDHVSNIAVAEWTIALETLRSVMLPLLRWVSPCPVHPAAIAHDEWVQSYLPERWRKTKQNKRRTDAVIQMCHHSNGLFKCYSHPNRILMWFQAEKYGVFSA